MAAAVTIGVDIGTTSVKAVAADGDGRVVATARVSHPVLTPAPNVLEHDARLAWRDGVRAAARQVAEAAVAAGHTVAGVNVAAMVPSLCPVDPTGCRSGRGCCTATSGPRAACGAWTRPRTASWSACSPGWRRPIRRRPGTGRRRPWATPRCAVPACIDSVTAMTTLPLFDFTGWDPAVCAAAGVRADRLPGIRSGAAPAGTIGPDLGPALAGAVVGGGTIDAFGEQLVAGADEVGDVLLIMGATLIVWACVADWVEAPGLWTVPHTAPGKVLVGGPSNAGGILKDWAATVLVRPGEGGDAGGSDRGGVVDPADVPVVLPYVRGERTPLHDRDRRGSFHGLSVAHGPAAMWRGVHEASGHSVRHHLDLAGVLGEVPVARRIVATGGGVRDAAWVQAVADVTGLPVDVVAVPEGGALGCGLPGPRGRGAGAGRVGRVPLGPHLAPGAAGPAVGGPVCGAPPHVRGADRATVRPRCRRMNPTGDPGGIVLLPDPEPAEVHFTLISVDDHLVEPPHLFRGRMPRGAGRPGAARAHHVQGPRDLGLRRAGLPAGGAQRRGRAVQGLLPHGGGALRPDAPRAAGTRRPGWRDMDLGGIWASVNFPSQITGFCGSVYSGCSDPELGLACVRAYNDWYFEEWVTPYPDRFVPIGITYLADPGAGAAEIRRNAARGFTAVSLPEQPQKLGYPTLHSGWWDPVVEACVETGTVICLHVGSSGITSDACRSTVRWSSSPPRSSRRCRCTPAPTGCGRGTRCGSRTSASP